MRLLVLFARRPKDWKGEMLFGKINADLFEFAEKATQIGLPCFAGFPAVRSVLELGEAFRTYWFPLSGRERGDLSFQVDLSRPTLAPTTMDGHALWTVELDALGDAVQNAKSLPWSDVIAAIRSMRRAPRRTSYGEFFGRGNVYSPTYILVPE